jgi:hypothetical protein
VNDQGTEALIAIRKAIAEQADDSSGMVTVVMPRFLATQLAVALVPSDEDNERVARLMAMVSTLGHSSALALLESEQRLLAQFALIDPDQTVLVDIEALRVAMMGTTDGDLLPDDTEIPIGEAYRIAADFLTALPACYQLTAEQVASELYNAEKKLSAWLHPHNFYSRIAKDLLAHGITVYAANHR